MQKSTSSVVVTLVVAAATAAMVALAASTPLPVPRAACVNAVMYLGLTAYAVYLARRTRCPLRAVTGPLAITGLVALTAGSVTAMALPAAAALAWIRSGIGCTAGRWRWAAELFAASAGLVVAGLLWDLRPGPLGWAAGVWGFGLVQAAYVAVAGSEPPVLTALMTGSSPVHRRAEALLRERRLEQAFRELGL
jgi:hypothetical protein